VLGVASTAGEDLAALALQRGPIAARALRDLNGPPFPVGTEQAWHMFCDLSFARPRANGAGPIAYSEILAYCALTDVLPTQLDLACIAAADSAFFERVNDEARAAEARETVPTKPTPETT
jgi:hypothetical protein